ncbi:hypothetical protein EMIHUDRAFT_228784 [Emiliania huxleyi CCMP1516]|uniref:Uncharacterized protein n=2 Tax=Emiliania huxleyi TaxID=2903 RepID=A0A0D3KEF2_EMIH1|nr:hypothetical protein EMIHUDRAFT_228784 [Emiliania huxleyi CCMP1516]EOD34137.1 hypothetical protein EMIHUDRAFT_228784 [Emiliania huxleyi CCMP1516]|eukprot:XP_005786566.1 hypothetical protein EMIHUDRAFT_228784 [Emiliania huxleyi CCMP1516]
MVDPAEGMEFLFFARVRAVRCQWREFVSGDAVLADNARALVDGLVALNGLQGNHAFLGCGSLRSVTFVEGVRLIGDEAFRGSQLTEVTLPPSLERVG